MAIQMYHAENVEFKFSRLRRHLKHCSNKINAFEPVPLSADRQQQFYLYQLP